jgi:hypothetical protein
MSYNADSFPSDAGIHLKCCCSGQKSESPVSAVIPADGLAHSVSNVKRQKKIILFWYQNMEIELFTWSITLLSTDSQNTDSTGKNSTGNSDKLDMKRSEISI